MSSGISLSGDIRAVDSAVMRAINDRRRLYIIVAFIAFVIAAVFIVCFYMYRQSKRRATQIVRILSTLQFVPLYINNGLKTDGTTPRYFTYKHEYVISPMNQNKCGSCYIISVCNMLSDRICIATGGRIREMLSPQYLLCNDSGDTGSACSGGSPETVLEYIRDNGAILDKYMPYNQGENQDNLNKSACVLRDQKAIIPENKVYIEPSSIRFLCRSFSRIGSGTHLENIERMKREIIENGCIVGTIYVHEDLYLYEPGTIYRKSKGSKFLYGHSIEIVGFCDATRESADSGAGACDNTYGHVIGNEPYWIVKNSWGLNFGSQGYLFVRMYWNECEIESRSSSAIPRLPLQLYNKLIRESAPPLQGASSQTYEVIY